MSEEFEDVAVVETAPVESAAPVDTGVAYVPEALPSEVEATELNLNSADDVLKNNDQQVYNEINAPDRVSESAAPITAQAVAAKEEKKAEERSQSFEAYEEQLKQSAARKEFMNKDHDFGGMKMSGADLNKLIDFYQGNPQMLDKLKDKMVKSGMSKDKADKGVKELQEYMDLKKKEKDGALTAEQEMRLKDINKSAEFKVVAQEATQFSQENGIQLTQNTSIENTKSLLSSKGALIQDGQGASLLKQEAVTQTAIITKAEKRGFGTFIGVDDSFSTAPHLTEDFSKSSNVFATSKASPQTPAAEQNITIAAVTKKPAVSAGSFDASFS